MQSIDWSKAVDRRYGLLLFVAVLALFCFIKMLPPGRPAFDSNIKYRLTQYRSKLGYLDQKVSGGESRMFYTDTLNFPDGWQLIHRRLGEMRAWKNFKLNVEARMEVLIPGEYKFMIGSDDGFRLKIGDKTVCEFLSNRGFAWNTGKIHLSKGEHKLRLIYYQGFGKLGLIGRYQRIGGRTRLLGENGRSLRFIEY